MSAVAQGGHHIVASLYVGHHRLPFQVQRPGGLNVYACMICPGDPAVLSAREARQHFATVHENVAVWAFEENGDGTLSNLTNTVLVGPKSAVRRRASHVAAHFGDPPPGATFPHAERFAPYGARHPLVKGPPEEVASSRLGQGVWHAVGYWSVGTGQGEEWVVAVTARLEDRGA